jgi:hypothetical protein
MPDLRQDTAIPKTLARLRWAVKLKVGLDVSDIAGLSPSTVDAAASLTQLVTNNLKDVGSVEEIELTQNRTIEERYAFNSNPLEPFQTVPMRLGRALKLSGVKLKAMSEAESVFNWFPNNLVFQQMPFVLQIIDAGDTDKQNTLVQHYIFNCWFADSSVKWSTTDTRDQRLIQTVNVKCGRILTLDGSNGGNAIVQTLESLSSGITAIPQAQSLINNLGLS